ncbi:hypothetical protein BJL95_03920 [Methylomonas sp. LWB]|uniref:hypothetical protein n=1 Tax=Methylomonas sp. LWB TaxID=1905845 RepID=UPI0008DABD24|nr:hypothetical protein [Methylomonas sp. LWB]OHX34299.1 hypothetical protein BJL95_03920 [Methylomonas sp. LWB]
MHQNIRWKQRFANYQNALAQLTKFIDKGELKKKIGVRSCDHSQPGGHALCAHAELKQLPLKW